MGVLELTEADVAWLRSRHPSLHFDAATETIAGELSFCAGYDKHDMQLYIEDREPDGRLRAMDSFICDVAEVDIRLDCETPNFRGWPKVYEVGGRSASIAAKYGVELSDLHVEADRACCLGIRYTQERNRTIDRYLRELVIPFFYRLAYIDRHGMAAAQNELWGEYAHGHDGQEEHARAMADIARRSEGRNRPCPCGSGTKYKRCCLIEVEAALRMPLLSRHSQEEHSQT